MVNPSKKSKSDDTMKLVVGAAAVVVVLLIVFFMTRSKSKNNIAYIKITNPVITNDSYMHYAELEIFNAAGTKIPKSELRAEASSVYAVPPPRTDGPYPAELLIDGDYNTMWHSEKTSPNEFIKVTLTKPQPISKLVLTNGPTNYENVLLRAVNTVITLYRSDDSVYRTMRLKSGNFRTITLTDLKAQDTTVDVDSDMKVY